MLVDQIERISNGELTATTDISQESAYYEYSQKLTNIGQGMEKALETQSRNIGWATQFHGIGKPTSEKPLS